MGNNRFWTEERLMIAREIYLLPRVTEHIVAVTEFRKRGIKITAAAAQALSNRKEFNIKKPYILRGKPSRDRSIKK
jgi:hypothetical protein